MSQGADWVQAYVNQVLQGHAGKTLDLVIAARRASCSSVDGPLASELKLEQLRQTLDASASSAARNRLLRRWLEEHRVVVVRAWASLGFPAPPPDVIKQSIAAGLILDEPVLLASAPDVVCEDRLQSSRPAVHRPSAYAGVAVFDFDQTLTVKHVGVFEDMSHAELRIFGGPKRLAMLCAVMEQLVEGGAAIAMVSRNSRHVVWKALESVGLLQFVAHGFEVTRGSRLVFGFEDYEDTTPKSEVILQRVLRPLGLTPAVLLFVDDDRANINDVRERCPGATLVQPPRQGMDLDECELLLAWAQKLSSISRHAAGAAPTSASRPPPEAVQDQGRRPLPAAAKRRHPSRNLR